MSSGLIHVVLCWPSFLPSRILTIFACAVQEHKLCSRCRTTNHSFLRLNGIPRYLARFVYPFVIHGRLACFYLLAFVNNAAESNSAPLLFLPSTSLNDCLQNSKETCIFTCKQNTFLERCECQNQSIGLSLISSNEISVGRRLNCGGHGWEWWARNWIIFIYLREYPPSACQEWSRQLWDFEKGWHKVFFRKEDSQSI